MFGYVMANIRELDKATRIRYGSVYCGICHSIRDSASNRARMMLSYDMAFLAILLSSLYEPEEKCLPNRCLIHPCTKRPRVDSEYVRYAADMNVALGYYKCRDDENDEGKRSARVMAGILEKDMPKLREKWPRQCDAIEKCLQRLSALEQENCPNPDAPAGCFGELMGELLVYREDLWASTLREMGKALGRYIYLADAATDYRRDTKKSQYNPFAAMGTGEDWLRWEQYLLLSMGRCTEYYEKLPLVQDKALLDNILYSGVWVEYRKRQGRNRPSSEERNDARSV